MCDSSSTHGKQKLTWLRRRKSLGEEVTDWTSSQAQQVLKVDCKSVKRSSDEDASVEVERPGQDVVSDKEGVVKEGERDARQQLSLNVVAMYAEEGIMWSPGTVKNHLQMRFESLASPDVKTEVCASSTSTSPLTSAATSTAAPLHRGQVLLIDRKTKAVQRTQSPIK